MLIVGIGGTQRQSSSSETALRIALAAAERLGCETMCFAGPALALPVYNPTETDRTAEASALISSLRQASGVIISSPGYHGSVSGMIKNALDYVEDMAHDPDRVYFDGLPIGCIAVAHGWQGAVNTLRALRDIAHSLRGFPTPYGLAINAADRVFAEGICTDATVSRSLTSVGAQVANLAQRLSAAPLPVAD
jgi:FMN reductase